LIDKGADQQIDLARAAMPGAKWELVTERLEALLDRPALGARPHWMSRKFAWFLIPN
jgi:hypothetical protein